MKAVVLIILIIANLLECITAQNIKEINKETFILYGSVKGRDTGRIVLKYQDNLENRIIDTTYLIEGKFSFKGKIVEPTYASITGYPNYFNFYDANDVGVFLEPGIQNISLIENDYEHAKMNGSKTQEELNALQMEIDSVKLKTKVLSDEYLEVKRKYLEQKDRNLKSRLDSLYDLLKPTAREVQNVVIRFIACNPDSYVSSYMLGGALRSLSFDSSQLLYNRFTSRIKNGMLGKWNAKEINKKKLFEAGSKAPNFNAIKTDGEGLSLSQFRGKFVLLDFWASWCIPCRKAIPQLKEFYNQYHERGFEIIGISIDENKKKWKDAVKEEDIYWYNVISNEEISRNYPNTNLPIPSQILIDNKGNIIWNSNNKNDMRRIENILAEVIK